MKEERGPPRAPVRLGEGWEKRRGRSQDSRLAEAASLYGMRDELRPLLRGFALEVPSEQGNRFECRLLSELVDLAQKVMHRR